MKIFSLANQKGGVAKTTSAINIGGGLALRGFRVLLIDLDPQGNLTTGLGLLKSPEEQEAPTVSEVLTEDRAVEEVVVERPIKGAEHPLHVLPATLRLSDTERALYQKSFGALALSEALEDVNGYDYCIIDCPPSLGMLTVNALTSTEAILMPIQAEYYALSGVVLLDDVVSEVRRRNKALHLAGAFVTLYDRRRRAHVEGLGQLKGYFGENFDGGLFKTVVRIDTRLSEAPSHGKTIFEYRAKSRGAEDYANLVTELVERDGKAKTRR